MSKDYNISCIKFRGGGRDLLYLQRKKGQILVDKIEKKTFVDSTV